MDMMMPNMDGVSATRAIRALARADAKTIPIIAMTANAFDEDAKACFEAGMNAHLAKPFQIDVYKRQRPACTRDKSRRQNDRRSPGSIPSGRTSP